MSWSRFPCQRHQVKRQPEYVLKHIPCQRHQVKRQPEYVLKQVPMPASSGEASARVRPKAGSHTIVIKWSVSLSRLNAMDLTMAYCTSGFAAAPEGKPRACISEWSSSTAIATIGWTVGRPGSSIWMLTLPWHALLVVINDDWQLISQGQRHRSRQMAKLNCSGTHKGSSVVNICSSNT